MTLSTSIPAHTSDNRQAKTQRAQVSHAPNAECSVCHTPIYRAPAELRRNKNNYCSLACRDIRVSAVLYDASTHVAYECEVCHKACSRPRTHVVSAESTRFCSPECRKASTRAETVRKIDQMGYVAVRVNGRWTHEHRVVMEQKLGRSLTRKDIIHHINHDKTDNRPENLELMGRSAHQSMHYKERYPLDAGAWGEGRERCIECGGTDYPHKARGTCGRCYRRHRTLAGNPQAPTRVR